MGDEAQKLSRSNSLSSQQKKPTSPRQSSSFEQHQLAESEVSTYAPLKDRPFSQTNLYPPDKKSKYQALEEQTTEKEKITNSPNAPETLNWSERISKDSHSITIDSPTQNDYDEQKNIEHTIESSDLPGKTRRKFKAGKGNIAFAEYDIDGQTGKIPSFSGPQELEGFAPFVENEKRNLQAKEIGHNRDVDTEAKILEQIFLQSEKESTGTIRLFTKLPVCDSCGDVIEEFAKLRPEIEIKVVEGKT